MKILFLVSSSLFISTNAFYAAPSKAFYVSSSQVSMSSTDEQTQNDIFAPLKQLFSGITDGQSTSLKVVNDYDEPIANAKAILNRAVETKSEDPELVCQALEDLEKLMR